MGSRHPGMRVRQRDPSGGAGTQQAPAAQPRVHSRSRRSPWRRWWHSWRRIRRCSSCPWWRSPTSWLGCTAAQRGGGAAQQPSPSRQRTPMARLKCQAAELGPADRCSRGRKGNRPQPRAHAAHRGAEAAWVGEAVLLAQVARGAAAGRGHAAVLAGRDALRPGGATRGGTVSASGGLGGAGRSTAAACSPGPVPHVCAVAEG